VLRRTGASALALASLGAFTLFTGSARADDGGYYAASARATVADFYFTNPTIPGGIKPEGGGPETDVAQTSLNKGDANAQFPYLGDYVPGLPGVASGLFGFPVPPYPLAASSTFGSDPGVVSYPGISLNTASRTSSTVSDAIVGSTGSGATSHSEVNEDSEGTITATSTAASPLTVLGPVLSLKGFNSVTTVTADSSGAITRSSNLSIDQISAPGLVLRIPENTPSSYPVPVPFAIPGVSAPPPIPAPSFPVPAGGQTIVEPNIGFEDGYFVIQLPFAGNAQKYTLPAQAVIAAFKAQGVTLSYTAPQKTDDGLIGGVFSMSYTLPAPPPNQYYNGATPVTYIVGSTSAAVKKSVAKAAPATAPGLPLLTPPPAGGAVPASAVAPALPPAPPAAVSAAAPPTVNLQPAEHRSAAADLVSAALPAFVGSDLSNGYLVVIVIGLALLVSVFVLGAKGVGARWNS
jgi:hypothetical protein